ncbi:MAG: restriction endonuclease subunit S [Vicinamibacterales bacterium]
MTAAERVIAHFDRISEAPGAIARLRRFILDLAVRGRLVDQDPSDEPASTLVERIQAAKRAEGIRARKVDAFHETELPFAAPDGWTWARIGQVTSDRGQAIPAESFTYIDVTSIDKEVGRIAAAKVLSVGDAPSRARKRALKGDLLYSCVRPYLLNVAVIDRDFVPPPIASTAFAVLNGFGLVVPQYLWIALRSPAMVTQVESKMRGQAYPAINDSDFQALPFPLPPLAEQHRVVAKVDELMALCDRLEAAQKKRESRRDRLVNASLARLNQPGDAPALHEHTRFHLQHLPRMTSSRAHVQQLRQTILHLAVGGKLVPQLQNEEPAKLPMSAEEWLPAAVPNGWRYVPLASLLAEDTRNGYSRKPDEIPGGTPILRISACTIRGDGVVAEEEHKLISGIGSDVRLQHGLNVGDLLACRFNGNRSFVGRLAIFRDRLRLQPIYPDKLIRVRVARELVAPAFIRFAGDTGLVRRQIEAACATTVGNWGISASNLKEVRFPVPPLAEQRRIVAKVDELMAVCDRLEAQLEAGRVAQGALLEATLRDVLTAREQAPMIAPEFG